MGPWWLQMGTMLGRLVDIAHLWLGFTTFCGCVLLPKPPARSSKAMAQA